MEFPRHMHKPEGQYVAVVDQEQYDACAANGWGDQPEGHVEKPVEVRFFDAAADAPDGETPKKGKKGKKD